MKMVRQKMKDLKKEVTEFICKFAEEYQKENNLPDIWREPVVGFGDANDEYFANLKNVVTEVHKLPQFFIPDAKTVISYFVPFKEELAATNIDVEGNYASAEWAKAYTDTNNLFSALNPKLAEFVKDMGYDAAVPYDISMMKDILMSSWSQKHVAVGCGVGTFGLNHLLITERGCCGRISSIVTTLPVEPTKRYETENCLFKREGKCKKCVERCFSGALTEVENDFDRFHCRKICQETEKLYNEECCGKCDTGLPCSHQIP